MKKKNYIPSLLIAYLLSISAINRMMGIVLDKSDGIMIMNLIPVAALLALHFFMSDKKKDLNMNKSSLLFVYYIVSVIVVYKYAAIRTTLSYTNVFVYCFIPVYLSFYKVDVEKILKYMMFFSALLIPVSGQYFKSLGYSYETIGMSATYSILPFVIAAATHFMYYRKKIGFFISIGYAINIYYLLQIVYFGNRGAIITLMVFSLLVFLNRTNSEGTIKKTTGKAFFITVLVGIISILVVSNIEIIILTVHKWLSSMGIEFAFISKSVVKMSRGDLSNGRNSLFDFVIQGIGEHFLVGNGISSIWYKSFGRFPYPHNLFLQMWYDLGIIVSLPLLFMVGKAFKRTLFDSTISKGAMVLFVFLFSLSIPRLCYSSEFWGSTPFWLLMMFTISPNIYDDNSVKVKDCLEDEGVENE